MVFWEGGPEGEPGHHDRQAQRPRPLALAQAGLILELELPLCHGVCVTAVPITKLFAWGETMEDMCVFSTTGPSTIMCVQ
jgi:hypothetical protein